ncbi:hypothetical protein [Arthrobacter sp. ov118]|jgi:hypothetical protein|uniref:hypothetical protein n=1 Tax=Arthrobacter sp. ov118 TaxID=1761747 RepID=UPI0008E07108|nr:hypothetical protein [Arthrobacter sp. ov118]SFT68199.1 hypothetical protein SAMN04487915_102195 [Arthrobacter sp. ov118]
MLSQQIATFVAAAGESGSEELAPLIAPPFVIGGAMFLVLVVLLLITLSYSNLGRRHAVVDEHADPHRQHPNKHDHGQGH